MTLTTFDVSTLDRLAYAAITLRSDSSDVVTVERHPKGPGQTAAIRGGLEVPVTVETSPVVIYDTEVPLWQNVSYTASIGGTRVADTPPIRMDGPWKVGNIVAHAWLRHLSRPNTSRPVLVQSFGAVTRSASAGVHRPLNSPTPVIVSGPRQARTGQFTLVTFTNSQAIDLRTLLDESALLLTTHPLRGVGLDGLYFYCPETTEERLTQSGQERLWTVPYQEVAIPIEVGLRDIGPKYDDLATEYATYKDLSDEALRGVTYDDLVVAIPPP